MEEWNKELDFGENHGKWNANNLGFRHVCKTICCGCACNVGHIKYIQIPGPCIYHNLTTVPRHRSMVGEGCIGPRGTY